MFTPARAWLLLVAAAVGLSTVSLPAPASAAGEPPLIWGAAMNPGTPSILKVSATSDSPVHAVIFSVVDGRGEHAWVLTKEEDEEYVWATEPMVLQLGVWTGTVTATDEDGDTSTATRTIDYRIAADTSSYEIESPRLDYENPTIKAHGSIRGYDPRPGRGERPPDGVVQLAAESPTRARTVLATTSLEADGSYAFDVPPPPDVVDGERLTVKVEWRSDPNTTKPGLGLSGADPAVVTSAVLPVSINPSRLVLDATGLNVREPAKAVVRGVVEGIGDPSFGWGGVHVRVSSGGTSSTVVTDDAGRFSASLAVAADATVTAAVDEPVRAVYMRAVNPAVTDTLQVHVVRKTSLTWSDRTIAANWITRAGGKLTSPTGTVPANLGVYVQDSKDGRTGWRNVGFVVTKTGGSFSGAGPVIHPSRYHRLVFAGSADLQSAVTPAYRLSRHETRIVKARATPAAVRKGKKVTVRGVVQRESGGSFVHLGKGQAVRVFFRAKGSSKVVYKGYTRTTSSGSFAKAFTATKDGYWSAVWFARSSMYVNAYGAEKYVNVTGIGTAAVTEPVPASSGPGILRWPST